MANPVGRPPKLTELERKEVYDAFKAWIDTEEDPSLVSFISYNDIAIQYNVTDDNIYDWAEFSGLRKRSVKKQEAYLLKQGGANKYNPTIAIFRLKQPQHGYTDRQTIDAKVEQVTPILGGAAKDAIPSNNDNS